MQFVCFAARGCALALFVLRLAVLCFSYPIRITARAVLCFLPCSHCGSRGALLLVLFALRLARCSALFVLRLAVLCFSYPTRITACAVLACPVLCASRLALCLLCFSCPVRLATCAVLACPVRLATCAMLACPVRLATHAVLACPVLCASRLALCLLCFSCPARLSL